MKDKIYSFSPKSPLSKTYFERFAAKLLGKEVISVDIKYNPETGTIDKVDIHYKDHA